MYVSAGVASRDNNNRGILFPARYKHASVPPGIANDVGRYRREYLLGTVLYGALLNTVRKHPTAKVR